MIGKDDRDRIRKLKKDKKKPSQEESLFLLTEIMLDIRDIINTRLR